MRHKNETATSFDKLKEITQIMQAQKNSAQTSDFTPKRVPKPKGRSQSLKSSLKPTKRAFSDRQIATIRDNSQASAQESQRGR
ncbi:hypothetical protein E5E06_06830 [Helicobacter pylori]|nr:hypothetical protein E5E06_06830 [Helicobacter pylori]